jgi:uncharacterized membrane protein YheB (UPF0754 family)
MDFNLTAIAINIKDKLSKNFILVGWWLSAELASPCYAATVTPLLFVSIPLVGALIGWATNVLAIRMLFRPRAPLRLGWFHLQGVIPRRKAALAGSMAEIFERELLSNQELVQRFQRIPLSQRVEPMVEGHINSFMTRLVERMPIIRVILNEPFRGSIAKQLKQELMGLLPQVQEKLGQSLGQEIDLRKLIEERVRAFSEERLEALILSVARRELKAIEWFGGLLGFAIGLGQVMLMALLR